MADCAYTGSGTGMHRSAGCDDGGTYIYGKLAQAYARTAYACFDQPDLKAEFTFRVIAPAQWTVLSNSPGRWAAVPGRGGPRGLGFPAHHAAADLHHHRGGG